MVGSNYYGLAWGFDAVEGKVNVTDPATGGTSGGTDSASLYDALGSDTLYSGPAASRLEYSSGRTTQASGFRYVYGLATAGDNPALTDDEVYFYGSADDNTFFGNRDAAAYSAMIGTGFYNYAEGFDYVEADVDADGAVATHGTGGAVGGSDTAHLYDSALNDLFAASGDVASWDFGYDTVVDLLARGFDFVGAHSRSGDSDTKQETLPINFSFVYYGDWP